MQRRKFIAAVGSAAIALPLIARAQPARKLPMIGFLGTVATGWRPWTDAFEQRLQQLGWTKGSTIAIEYRWDEGRPERDAEVAAEFVRLKADVIVTNDPGAVALKNATAAIPIVFALAPDPIGAGLVTHLAHPGGNITGLSLQSTDLAGKRLEYLHSVVPHLRKLAVVFNGGYRVSELERDEVAAAARALDVEIVPLEIHGAEDIAPTFASLKGEVDSLYVVGDALTFASRAQIMMLALGAKLPGIFSDRLFSRAGGLMSYGPNFEDLFKRAAEMADKILRGANPGDIPVEQPTKFELAVNLKTAKALGITIPPTLLARADEVIE